MTTRPTVVLAVSRQLASGGSQIAAEVARRLGYSYADREVLREAAALMHVSEADLAGAEERVPGMWERVSRVFALGAPDGPFLPLPVPRYETDLFEVESDIIRGIAQRLDVVIVGRGAGYVLRSHPGLVSVFVHAPLPARLARARQHLPVSDEASGRVLLERSDRDRNAFWKTIVGRDWTDARSYSLCIDSAAVGHEKAVDLLVELCKSRERWLASQTPHTPRA